MSAVEKLLSVAAAEIGYLEKQSSSQLDDKTANAGYNNYTKYARDLDALGVYNFPKNGYEWCDMFVDWCFVQAFGLDAAWRMTGQAMRGAGAGCTYSAQYYQRMGRFSRNDPKPGDQIFFTQDGCKTSCHTGIVEKIEGGRVFTIEGNTSSASGVVANGGTVARKSYALGSTYIYGYGRPDWTVIGEQGDEDMDVEKFKELWAEMRKELQDNDAAEYSAAARKWAVENGIIAGGSDAGFNGMWQDILTREQMVTVLYRFAKLMGVAV